MSDQAYSGNKRPRETYEVGENDEVMLRETQHVVTNITISKPSTSSPFQGKLGRKNVQLIRPQRPKSYPFSPGDDNVIGIEDDVLKLVQQLINPQGGNFFAMVGMGGSGKTTLARKIYNHEKISRYFDCKAWVCVSQVWNEESVLKDIFWQTTGQSSNNLTDTEIVHEIHKLLADKLYLVLLDDVWETDVLRKIMVPTAKPKRSKFIITTRNQKVIQFSDLVFQVHKPRRLTDYQSFELFKKIAFGYQSNTNMEHTNAHFVDLAKEMLKKCDGLPLAVISLSGLLRSKKTIHEWIKVGNNVSSKIIEDHAGPSDYGRVEDILSLSYSDLNYTLKSCFMYLSLFPEDAVISCGMLMRCWIAEGFFKSVWLATTESIEDVARKYLDELIQRCLVQIVKVNYVETAQAVTVHDLLRDIAIKKARAKYFSNTLPSDSSPPLTMQILRLGIISIDHRDQEKIVEDKVSRRLRTFISLKNSFTNYPLLRVLILRCNIHIPDAIGSLIHLRYLRLSFFYNIDLPDSIQNLRNLLSFDIRTSEPWNKSRKVPNLKQMKKLRYLCLPWGYNADYENPLNLHDLRNLRVLWGIPSGKWIMRELKYLSPTVEKLGIFSIVESDELEEVYRCPSIVENNLYALRLQLINSYAQFEMQKLQHCSKLKKLHLEGEIAARGVPIVFPPYLLKLKLDNSGLDDHYSFAHALQTLTYLKVLRLDYFAYVGDDLTFPANSLLNLETLHLHVLEEVKRIHVKEGAMPHLKSFIVDSCYSLKVIHANYLLNLEKLHLYQLPKIERIHVMEGGMPHLKSFQVDEYFILEVIPQSLRHLVKKIK